SRSLEGSAVRETSLAPRRGGDGPWTLAHRSPENGPLNKPRVTNVAEAASGRVKRLAAMNCDVYRLDIAARGRETGENRETWEGRCSRHCSLPRLLWPRSPPSP